MLKLLKKIEEKPIDSVVMRLFSSWCLTALFFLLSGSGDFTDLKSLSEVGLTSFFAVLAASFVIQTVAKLIAKKDTDRLVLPVSFAVYGFAVALMSGGSFFVGAAFAFLGVVMLLYFDRTGGVKLKKPFSAKKRNFLIIMTVVVFSLVCGSVGVFRYLGMWSPNYDFGIFAQMFHNMRESLSPVTTCERDGLLSHFAVHVSPIYYLLLPFYYVFPSPVTLQICQTAVLASAAAPAYLLCRHYKLSDAKTACVVAFTLLQPVVMCGTKYDLHENCFLFPLLLWVFWAFEREKYVLYALFSVLTLCVKEDAAVYIVFFAVFVILNRKKYLVGVLTAICAGVWFLATTLWLSKYGDGVMSYRYANYLAGEGTLLDVVKNVLVDPAYVFTQLFADDKGGTGAKLLFFAELLLPLAFLPFATKKVSRLLLLLPAVLINFMTVYPYQYNIGFQYSFGSASFLTFLAIMNLADMKPNTQRLFACAAVICSVSLFVTMNVTEARRYMLQYVSAKGEVAVIREALSEIPTDASVCASTFLVPQLSRRSELYEVYYHKPAEGERLDYIILDSRSDCTEQIEKYESLGYSVTKKTEYNGRTVLVFMEPAENAENTVNDEPSENTEAAKSTEPSESTVSVESSDAAEIRLSDSETGEE